MTLQLLTYPKDATALRAPGKTVTPEMRADADFIVNLEAMKTMLSELDDGMGLAATQVGWGVQVFILSQDENFKTIEPKVFINPKILKSGKKKEKKSEGCLSFPGLFLDISRPDEIEYEYENEAGERVVETARGYYARAIIHEVNHLQGRLMIDDASPVQKIGLVKKWLAVQRD